MFVDRAALAALCWLLLTGAAPLLAGAATFPEIDRGLSWLDDQPRLDGTLVSEALSVGAVVQARAEAFHLLQSKATLPAPAVDALLATAEDNTEFVARKAIVAGVTARDTAALTALLGARQNDDGGFAPAAGYQSSVLDTAWALLALRAVSFGDAAVSQSALGFLAQRANADGGFGPSGRSDLFHSAYVLMALQAHSGRFGVSPAALPAFNWIAGRQVQGVYGGVIDNAVATLALHSASTDSSLYAGAVAALRASQSADGSWGGDPYATALALSALIAGDGTPSPNLTGSVSGTLRDPVSGAPIAGAQIVVTGATSLTAFSGPSGAFLISGLVPGPYTLQISKAGYATTLVTVQLAAGVTASVGSLQVRRAVTTATVHGQVIDGSTGAPLAGASVSIPNAGSAVTDATGAYAITGLFPGAFTVTASKQGYDSASGAGQLAAGGSALFSPSLYPSGQTPGEASLRGRVVDQDTDAPLAGASVSVGALSTSTDASGAFSLNGFAPGTISIEFSASGYRSAAFLAALSAGVNQVGTVELARQPTTLALSGRVTDAESSLPIGGAQVQLVGADLRATSDPAGVYRLEGIGLPEFALSVTAPGYSRRALNVSLLAVGDTTVDVTLQRPASDGLTIRSVRTDKPAYDPYESIEIEVELANAAQQERHIAFAATVFDPQGRALIEIPARGVVPPPIVLAPNAQTEIELETYTAGEPAGLYSVEVRGYDDSGELVLQGSTSFRFNPLRRFGGGIELDPPITQAGTNQPVGIALKAFNQGNLPIPAGPVQLVVTLERPDPSVGQRAQSIARTIASGSPLNGVVAAVYDAQGVLYAVNKTDRKVLRIGLDGSITTLTTLPLLFSNPSVAVTPVDLALDTAGELYVLNRTLEVFKVSAAGVVTRIRTGLPAQSAFHLDGAGNFYILDNSTNTASLTRFTPGSAPVVLISKGLSKPVGMAEGRDGLVYVTSFGENAVVRLTSTGAVQPFVTGLNRPQGMVADAAGNFYLANSGSNSIVKITPAGVSSVFATGLSDPYALAWDSSGNLVVTNRGEARVVKVRSDGTVVAFARGLASRPAGMRYGAAGNLYVVAGNGVSRLGPDGEMVLLSTLSDGWGVALGSGADVFVTRPGAGQVVRIGPAGVVPVASGLASPLGVAIDPAGTLYVAEGNANRISAIDASGQRRTVTESYLQLPEDVAVAPSGEAYVLNSANIGRLTATSGARVGQGLSAAGSLAFGPDGNVYLQEPDAIRRVDPAGNATALRTGLPTLANAIAVDEVGNLYVAETASRELKRLDPAGGTTRMATLSAQPIAISRDVLGIVYVLLSNGQIVSVDAAGSMSPVATAAGTTRIARDTGNRLYLLDSSRVRVLDLQTKAITDLITQSGLTSIAATAGGELLATHAARNELRTYDAQGNLLQAVAGFASPRDMVWSGSELVFHATGTFYALAPAGLPRIIGSGPANHLDARDGVVYASTSSGASRLTASGTLQLLFSQTGFTEPSGVAVRADGALTLASLTTDRVLTLTQAGQVIASYAGITSLKGVAVDGQDNVYVVSDSGRQIVKIAPNGGQSSVFALGSSFATSDMLAFDATGQLYATSANQLRRFDTSGVPTVVATSTGNFGLLGAILPRADAILVADNLGSMVRKVAGDQLVVFSAGLDDPRRVKIGPDGLAYVVSWANGTVLRVSASAAELYAANLASPTALDFGAGGTLYVAEASGRIVRVERDDSQVRYEDLMAVLSAIDVDALSVSPNQSLAVARSRVSDLIQVTFLPAVPAPQPGSVVHTAIAALAEIATGPQAVSAGFGSWVPPYGGDFRFSVRSLTGVDGEAVNFLHVGPGASGLIAPARNVLPPGDTALAVQVSLRGEDVITLTRVEPGNVRLYATKVQDFTPGATQVRPTSIAADAAGNVYFTFHKDLRRVVPGADPVVVFRGPDIIQMSGGIPIDSAQNLYITAGSAGNQVLRIAQDGTSAPLATLPEQIWALARDSQDQLVALTSNRIYRIRQDGSVVSLGTAGIDRPVSLTIDGRDNLYVHNVFNEVVKITPEGAVSAMVSDPSVRFEYEGTNIAGDCADNLFVTPQLWPALGQQGEEHTLVQVAGSTGQVTQVFNGHTINADLSDMDLIAYDRFGAQLLIWTDFSGGHVYSVPVRCGSIDTALHLVLPPGQQASGFSTAPNAVLTRPDGSAEYVWSLAGVGAAGRSVQFDTALRGLALGEQRAIAAEAFLLFRNTFVAADVKVPLAVPLVRVEAPVQLTVASDRPAYAASIDGFVDLRISNQDVASKQGRLSAEIIDAARKTVARIVDQSVSLDGNGTLDVLAPFNTGSWPPGTYSIAARLADSDLELARGAATFDVVSPDVSRSVGATIRTDKGSYAPADVLRLRSRIGNLSGNLALDAVTLVTRVYNPDDSLRFENTETLAQLAPGATKDYEHTLSLAFAAAGAYRATLTVRGAGGTELAASSAGFDVQSSATTGSGLTGTVAAAPKQVPLGEVVALGYSATNEGNAALSGLPLKLRIIDPVTRQIVAEFAHTVDLAVGAAFQGASSWTTAGRAGITYAAVLSATIGTNTRTLAQDLFTVVAPPVSLEVAQSLPAKGRVLVLVSCRSSGGEDDDDDDDDDHERDEHDQDDEDGDHDDHDGHGADHAACAAQRAEFLRSYLSGLGVEHTITTSAQRFEDEFRCGRHNVYWVGGGAQELSHTLVKSLREAVQRGEGLLLEGAHDERNKLLYPAAGVLYRGKLPKPDQRIDLQPGLFAAGSLATRGKPLKFDLTMGTTQAVYASTPGASAIVSNQFGAGRGLIFAFDLTATLQAAPNDAAWRAVLERTLAHLTRTAVGTSAGGLPVLTRALIRNRGVATTVEVTGQLPEGAAVLDAAPPATLDSQGRPVWRFDLAAGEERALDLLLRTPAAGGAHALTLLVGTVRNGAAQFYRSYALEIPVIGQAELEADAVAAVQALAPPLHSEINARGRAAAALQEAIVAAADNRFEQAITRLVDAADNLRSIATANNAGALTAVARLLQSVQLRACGQLPACTANSLSIDSGASFLPFQVPERLEVRGGRRGSADWEWGLGADTQRAGAFVHSNLDWVSGKTYGWTLRYDGAGQGSYTVYDGARVLFTKTYSGAAGPLRAGNALQLSVKTAAEIGAAVVAVTVDAVNEQPAARSLVTAGNNRSSEAALTLFHPPMQAGFSARGTLKLTFTGSAPPKGSRMSFTATAGNVSCR